MSTDDIIRKFDASDWQLFRSIRLRALEHDPDAFSSTFERETAFTEDVWKERLSDPKVAQFAAVSADNSGLGIAVGAVYDEVSNAAGLFGMWVALEARGRGVGKRLVNEVVAWARDAGFETIMLDVADDNFPAIALYESCGFLPNGIASTMPPPREHILEHQRVLEL